MLKGRFLWKKGSYVHFYLRIFSKHSVDEVLQFLQQPLTHLYFLAGQGC